MYTSRILHREQPGMLHLFDSGDKVSPKKQVTLDEPVKMNFESEDQVVMRILAIDGVEVTAGEPQSFLLISDISGHEERRLKAPV